MHEEANSSYLNTGAKADLYSGTTLRAHHYFIGNTPTFEMVDAATGLSIGIIHGKVTAKAAVGRQADDGGFGAVADLLLDAFGGEGMVPAPGLPVISIPSHVSLADLCQELPMHARPVRDACMAIMQGQA